MYVGGAGGYSFYVRKGEQVIRQRKNNSNYGASASRTYAQMIRRVKWGNLVNVFKAMKSWQPKAYDSKKQGQTDYNIFMQLNINKATAALTREMCLSGCAVIEPCQVSRGSLPPIALALAGSGNNYLSDIVIANNIVGGTTVGQLSTDILANNPQFQEGDNLAFCFFYNWKDSRVEWPFVATRYTEITLDTTSTTVINSIPDLDNRLSKSTGGFLQASYANGSATSPNNEVGMVLIHTRKNASMLAVSSQEIVVNGNSILSEFIGSAWYQACIDTYGLTDEVPLEPSFKGAVIQSVAVNGSEVPTFHGHQLNYSDAINLTIRGTGMNSDNVWLEHNGIRYTPLIVDGDSWTYILSSDGVNNLYVNGSYYGGVTIEGIEVPLGLPTVLSMWQAAEESTSESAAVNRVDLTSVDCINYPRLAGESLPYFVLRVRDSENVISADDFTIQNGTIELRDRYQSFIYLNVSVEDGTKPAFISLDGFIVAVFNYQ